MTSLQLAFLSPYVIIIPSNRANVFSAILCAVSLVLALTFRRKGSVYARPAEVIISLVLLLLVVLSGLFSLTPESSSVRGFTILASGLGGFWCSRILLGSPERLRHFRDLCILLLCGMLILSAASIATSGGIYQLLDSHWHPVADRLILLSFAPLTLLGARSRWAIVSGVILLCTSYIILLFGARTAAMGSAVVIPILLCLFAAVLWEWRLKQMVPLLLALFALSLAAGNALFYQDAYHIGKWGKHGESVAYRAESIFFSLKIAYDHPLLGNGLLAPRGKILETYQPEYPYISKETFVKWTGRLKTSENMFFTFLADLGVPFTVIYIVSLIFLMLALLRMVFHPPHDFIFHPLVLFLPLTGAILHYQVLDGLLHPQLSWFFHILLGLIPVSANLSPSPSVVTRNVLLRIAAFAGIAAVGLLLGHFLPPWFPLSLFK
ncbi:MAG: O-antigen ligase family protein [Desulfomonilaceae bacterium]